MCLSNVFYLINAATGKGGTRNSDQHGTDAPCIQLKVVVWLLPICIVPTFRIGFAMLIIWNFFFVIQFYLLEMDVIENWFSVNGKLLSIYFHWNQWKVWSLKFEWLNIEKHLFISDSGDKNETYA